jgi:hypothetical protein
MRLVTSLRGIVGTLALAVPFTARAVTIMPMGDSITVGVDYSTNSSGGYRDPLYTDLTAAGITVNYEGATNTNPTPLLTATNNTAHNGYGSYHIADLTANLDGSVQPSYNPGNYYGDPNQNGYWLTGGHGTGRSAMTPDIITLEIGTNDFLQQQQNGIDDRLTTLVTSIHALSPNTIIMIAGCIPVNGDKGFDQEQATYDDWIRDTLVPSLPYTRYVDLYDDFTLPGSTFDNPMTNSALFGADNVHPNIAGYPVIAATWASAIEQYESSLTSTVPEPASLGIIAVGAMALLTRKRR